MIALGHTPSFPKQRFAFLWECRNLPPPAYHYGKSGLLALQEAEQRRTGFPFTFIGDWQNQVDQLLLQEEAKHNQVNEGELDVAYQEVLSHLGKGRYPRITPQRFSERYTAMRQLL